MNKCWLFHIEDENGDHHDLNEDEFIGTYSEAVVAGEAAADEWETKTGGLVLRLELASQGRIK